MTQEQYNELKSNLVCPKCDSIDIELFFENMDKEDVSFEYVNPDPMAEENTDNEISFCCYCRDCSHDDIIDFFDEKLLEESRLHQQWIIANSSIKNLDTGMERLKIDETIKLDAIIEKIKTQ